MQELVNRKAKLGYIVIDPSNERHPATDVVVVRDDINKKEERKSVFWLVLNKDFSRSNSEVKSQETVDPFFAEIDKKHNRELKNQTFVVIVCGAGEHEGNEKEKADSVEDERDEDANSCADAVLLTGPAVDAYFCPVFRHRYWFARAYVKNIND